MSTNQFKQDLETYEQLRLAIGDDDLVDEGAVSPAEARSRSEAARLALEALPNPPTPFPKEEGGEEALTLPPGPVALAQASPIPAGREREKGPLWLEEYHQLLDQGWKWRIAAYIAWASSPKVSRWPETQQLLATQVLGLTSDRTIIAARKKNTAIDQTIAVMQSAPLMAHRRDVMDALVESAQIRGRNGNPDRKMYLEMTGDYKRTVKIEDGGESSDERNNVPAEELEQRAELLKKQRDRILKAAGEEEEHLAPNPFPKGKGGGNGGG